MKKKCFNCSTMDKDNRYFLHMSQVYCEDCLNDYFHDELSEEYFENFLEEDCEELE